MPGVSSRTITTASFAANETPRIVLNDTRLADWAGNNVTAQTNVTAADKARPSLQTSGITYNYSSRNLTLIFDEPIGSAVYASGIHLLDEIYRNKRIILDQHCQEVGRDPSQIKGSIAGPLVIADDSSEYP